jgi:hypothetical protein
MPASDLKKETTLEPDECHLAMACAKGDHDDPAGSQVYMKGRAWRFLWASRGRRAIVFSQCQAVARHDRDCWSGLLQPTVAVSKIMLFTARDERGIDRLQGLAMHKLPSVGPIGGDSELGKSGVAELSAVLVQITRPLLMSSLQTRNGLTNLYASIFCYGIVDTTLHRMLRMRSCCA